MKTHVALWPLLALVLIPLFGGLLKTHVALWPLLALVLIPLLGGLLKTHVALFDPLALAWIPLFKRFIGNPSGPSGPFFFGFIILPVIQFTGLYLI